jgi:hypothetical protein
MTRTESATVYMQSVAAHRREYDAAIARAVAFLEKHRSTLTEQQKAEVGELLAGLETGRNAIETPRIDGQPQLARLSGVDAGLLRDLKWVSAKADLVLDLLDQNVSILKAGYAWLSVLGGLTWAMLLLLNSQGTLLDDEIGHVLIARDAWIEPSLILNEWGRTATTLLFMPVAPFGLTAARFGALALSGLTVLLTVRLGRRLGVELPWAIPLLLFCQPWFAQSSFQALTEIPFALFAVAGWGLLLEGHLFLAGLMIGLLPLARHEGILLLGLWVAASAYRRQWSGVLGGLIPLVLYNTVSYLTVGTVPAALYFATRPTDIYGSGGWLHYAMPLLAGVGKPVALLAALGIPAMLRSPRARLFVSWNLIYMAMHVVFFRFGLFGSGGYGVFLVPIAPLVAIMAAQGLAALMSLLQAAHLVRRLERAGVALMMVVVTVLVIRTGSVAAPIPRDTYQTPMEEAASWLRREGLDRGPIVAAHVWLYYFLPLRIDSPRPPIESVSAGTVLVWDSRYSDMGGWPLADLSDPKNGWESLKHFGSDVGIYRKSPTAGSADESEP